jgi:hypothetical protein
MTLVMPIGKTYGTAIISQQYRDCHPWRFLPDPCSVMAIDDRWPEGRQSKFRPLIYSILRVLRAFVSKLYFASFAPFASKLLTL